MGHHEINRLPLHCLVDPFLKSQRSVCKKNPLPLLGTLLRDSLTPRDEHPKLSTDAKHLKDVTTKLIQLRLDHTEFTCLKALSLFKPGMK